MQDQSPESPEARRKRRGAGWRAGMEHRLGGRPVEVIRRVFVGVYSDGFIHAGNLAYMTLLSIFPFFIVAAAVAYAFGRSGQSMAAVDAFLATLPVRVATVLRQPIQDVLTVRTGELLWFGAIVGLWTVGSLIETIRDIVRRAYGTRSAGSFLRSRLASVGIIFVSVFAMLFALSLQVMMGAAEAFLRELLPFADQAITIIQASRLVPAVILFAAFYFLFVALTPDPYRARSCPKWPGAAMTALWWYVTILLLPFFLARVGNYNLTYGGLAGAMIALIFFFIIGLGVVIGAELNAALAEYPEDDERGGAVIPTEQGKETIET